MKTIVTTRMIIRVVNTLRLILIIDCYLRSITLVGFANDSQLLRVVITHNIN